MKNHKPSVHKVFIGIHIVLAFVTMVPTPTAGKISHLGYKAFCSFAPLSTLGLLALAVMHLFLHYRSVAGNEI